MVHPKEEEFHKGKSPIPETRTEEGSAKRNIARHYKYLYLPAKKQDRKDNNTMVHPKEEEFHKGKSPIPETRTEEGSAKRNIARKHDHDPTKKEKKQHGGAGGKGKWNDLDDGSLE
eukprot:CAMPEP_0170237944 /NCGR_PEP_ID=MMETSP0116_2-20130129/18726_1 /TAXON_ID=400756 /ORGANISM="Durinskia baltica, Strain CSIRO CS-38" /LENGTH=115 /DNA_ID=CAMNT_0010488755 /DNA_START=83 /DNA_END=429 /DNA_ORIENTATION=+